MRRPGPAILLVSLVLFACADDPPKTVDDARRLLAEDKQREARAILLELAEAEIADEVARAELAMLLLAVQESRKALSLLSDELFDTLLAERGKEAWAHRLNGWWLFRSDPEAAVTTLKKALALDEADPLSWAYLGSFLHGMGKIEGATQVLRWAASRFPDSPEVRASLAALILSVPKPDEKAWKEAARLLEPVAVKRPLDRGARHNLAKALRETGNYVRAEQVAEALCEEWPAEPAHWTALGLARRSRGRIKESIDAFEKAVELAPREIPPLLNLGNAFLALVDVELDREGPATSARRVFERAALLAPRDDMVYVGLGRAALKTNPEDDAFVEEAIHFYKKALEINPRNFAAHLNLALIYHDLWIPDANSTGEGYRKAMAHFVWAAELVPPEEWDRNARKTFEELKKRGK